jgi:hypothetical protein
LPQKIVWTIHPDEPGRWFVAPKTETHPLLICELGGLIALYAL